jgi:haloalkane dehalogenase
MFPEKQRKIFQAFRTPDVGRDLIVNPNFFVEEILGKLGTVRRLSEEEMAYSNIPKLLIYGEPGALITKPVVDWCMKNLSNLTTANIGAGIHYLQEDNPHAIGLEIAKWYECIL